MHQPLPPSLLSDDEVASETPSINRERITAVTATSILERLFGLGRRKAIAWKEPDILKKNVKMGVTNSRTALKGGRYGNQAYDGRSCNLEEVSKTIPISKNFNEKVVREKNDALSNTSTQGTTIAAQYISQTLSIHARLAAFKSLKPSPELNALFGELVGLAIKTLPTTLTHQIMSDPGIIKILPSLRTLCGTSECELEAHWATLITSSPARSLNTHQSTYDALTRFPYFQNYTDLARMEINALHGVLNSRADNQFKKIAFIGSGPLPLTSLCLLWQPNTPVKNVLNIDSNPDAIAQSSALCRNLGKFGEGMEFACESATNEDRDLSVFDVVFLAALVGGTQVEKEGVLKNVVGRMRKGALVVVRSSHGLRGLLYPEFEFTSEGVQRVLRVEVEVRPWGEVVNSVVVGRVI